MKRINMILNITLFSLVGLSILFPDSSMAQSFGSGGDLQGRVNGLTSSLLKFILPAVSVLGLIYAAILAAVGDAAAKSRMVMIAVASIVGFMAPVIIGWLQSVSGV